MYLEGIFIGGDIRLQLPEEAKKFDQIDKTFKKVGKWFYFMFCQRSCTIHDFQMWWIFNKHSGPLSLSSLSEKARCLIH